MHPSPIDSSGAALALAQVLGDLRPRLNSRRIADVLTECLASVKISYQLDRDAMLNQVIYILNVTDYPKENYECAFTQALGSIPRFLVLLTNYRHSRFEMGGLPRGADIRLVLYLDLTVAGGGTVKSVHNELLRSEYRAHPFAVVTAIMSKEAPDSLEEIPGLLFFVDANHKISKVVDPTALGKEYPYLFPGWSGSNVKVIAWIKRAPFYVNYRRVRDPQYIILEKGETAAQISQLLQDVSDDPVTRLSVRLINIEYDYYCGALEKLCRISPRNSPRKQQEEVEEFIDELAASFAQIDSTFLPDFVKGLLVSCHDPECYLKKAAATEWYGEPFENPNGHLVPKWLYKLFGLESLTQTRLNHLVAIDELVAMIRMSSNTNDIRALEFNVNEVGRHREVSVGGLSDCLYALRAGNFLVRDKVDGTTTWLPTPQLLYGYDVFFRHLFGSTFQPVFEENIAFRHLTAGREDIPNRLSRREYVTKFKTADLSQRALRLHEETRRKGPL